MPPDQTNVGKNFSNSKNLQSEIQAYAKIAGRDWTFYVKTLSVGIGRNTDNKPEDVVDIDLGPSKVVSRRHAAINYNLDSRRWELNVLGRNGLKIDGARVNHDDEPYPLHSGSVIDIGGTQMMFILPDSQPVVSPVFLNNLKDKRLKPDQKHSFSNVHQQDYQDNMTTYARKESVPSGPSVTSLEEDLSRDESKDIKPPYSYATMITQAILSNPDGIQSLSEIYNWISSHFAYYRHSKTGWQNSIRHNLSLNKAFEKVPRRPNEPGKGMKWQIAESYKQDFLTKWNDGSLNKARRGSSVSRQLQLHLMKNKQLPESRPTKPYLQEAPEIRTNYLYPPQRHPGPPPPQLPPPEFNFHAESPKQIHPVEAYTPERGRPNPNIQSSPALWNFVQFSTPMAPEKKDDAFYNNSPVKGASDLKDVDLAKGFD